MKKLHPYNKFITEGVRAKMTPKSAVEIQNALEKMIQYISHVVELNDKRIGMDEIVGELSPVIYRVRGIIYKLEILYVADVDVSLWEDWETPLNKAYNLRYDELPPDTLMELKEILEEQVSDDGILYEGIRDHMTPISKENIEALLEPAYKKIATELLGLETNGFGCIGISNYEEAYKFVITNKHRVWRLVDEYGTTEPYKIALSIQHDVRLGRGKKLDESVRDHMLPKSKEEIRQSLANLGSEKIYNLYINAIRKLDYVSLSTWNEYGCDINIRNEQKQTPLMIACQNDNSHPKLIKMLVNMGADMDLKDINDRTALMYAVDNNRMNIVKLFVELGVDLKKWNQGERALLRAVASNKDYDIVESLINAGVDVNYIDTNHSTALTYAATQSRRQVVKLLLSKGVDINIKNEYGMTPLMFAARGNDINLLQLLLDAGADTTIGNQNHQSAYDLAVISRRFEFARMIREYKHLKESVRAKMTPVSKDKIDKFMTEKLPRALRSMTDIMFTNGYCDNYQQAEQIIKDNEEYIVDKLMSGFYPGQIVSLLKMTIYSGKFESLRDKMTPKSKLEISQSLSGLTHNEKLKKGVDNFSPEIIKQALEEGAYDHLKDKQMLMFFLSTFCRHENAMEIAKILVTYGASIEDALLYGSQFGYILRKEILQEVEKIPYSEKRFMYKRKINESLRDKMTPKPNESIKKAMRKYFKDSKVMNKGEYVIETGVFENINNLYLVFDYEDYYEEIDTYFRKMIKDEEHFEMTIHGDTYKCYPKQKLVDFYDNTLTAAWYFERDKIDGIIEYIIKNM